LSEENKKNIFTPPFSRINLRNKQNGSIEDSSNHNHKITLQKPNPAVLNTNYAKELGDFLRHKAVLEKLQDGQYYWVLYDTHTGLSIGLIGKAKPEELQCWDPNQPDGIDHTREVKG
jgi:hypothetical protein